MAFERPVMDITLTAGGDLSADQFLFLKNSGGNVVVAAAATDQVIGVLQDTPSASGQAAWVRMVGISKVKAGGSISKFDLVTTNSSGKAVTITPGTDTTKYVLGRALEAASDGDTIAVAINCINIARGA